MFHITNGLLDSRDFSKAQNSKKFIIVHHTGSSANAKDIINYMDKEEVYISSHYIISSTGNIIQLVKDDYVARHCGISERKGLKGLNKHSIGIEVASSGLHFTDEHRYATRYLIYKLMKQYNIPKSNVLRHKDIAPSRKRDIGPEFYKDWFNTRKTYQESLNTRNYDKIQQLETFLSINSERYEKIPELQIPIHQMGDIIRYNIYKLLRKID